MSDKCDWKLCNIFAKCEYFANIFVQCYFCENYHCSYNITILKFLVCFLDSKITKKIVTVVLSLDRRVLTILWKNDEKKGMTIPPIISLKKLWLNKKINICILQHKIASTNKCRMFTVVLPDHNVPVFLHF